MRSRRKVQLLARGAMRVASVLGAVGVLSSAAVLTVFPARPVAAQQATRPADALARQADGAAQWVGQQRSDAAGWVGQSASDAASSVAQQASDASDSMAAQSAAAADAAVPRTPAPLAPNPEFAHFPRYRGMLGVRPISLRLGRKIDDPTGVHGEYQFADTGQVVLVAGDRDGDVLEVEESNDGTTITGNWVARFAADGSLAGERMNIDDSDPQPLDLHPLSSFSTTQ